MIRNTVARAIRPALSFLVVSLLLLGSACIKHKYDNPITKDTQQPDKVLFDTSIDDIEHGRYERARLTLQTMMNTYDTSEFLAKAKLAYADSWYREGGAHGLAQAEAEYKDFILFYPHMEEAAEAQFKICNMQFQQMDKADRDTTHARQAETECKDVILKWPNSKYAPDAAQKVRESQEVLAQGEMNVAAQYHHKGGNAYFSSANRLQALVDQYGLYSRADDALWMLADDYLQMGDKYENKQADAYTRIVRDYPLSVHVEDAKAQLEAMHRAVPEADPVAMQRMRYELDNRAKRGVMSKIWGPFASHPDVSAAAKSGTPQMESFKPTIPLRVPATAAGASTTNEVGISVVNNGTTDMLDKAPDARQATPGAAAPGGSASGAAAPGGAAPDGSNAAAGSAANPQAGSTSTDSGSSKKNTTRKLKQTPAKQPKAKKPSKKGTAQTSTTGTNSNSGK
jgi:outer membrane protein assembly factor BamD